MVLKKIESQSKAGEYWLLLNFGDTFLENEILMREISFIKVSPDDYFDPEKWIPKCIITERVYENLINEFKLADVYNYKGQFVCNLDIKHPKLKKREVVISNQINFKINKYDFFNKTVLEGAINNVFFFRCQDIYIPLGLIFLRYYYSSTKIINLITNYEKLSIGFKERNFEECSFVYDNTEGIGNKEAKEIGRYWFTHWNEQKTGFNVLKGSINYFYNNLMHQKKIDGELRGEIPYKLPFDFPLKATVLCQKLDNEKFIAYRIYDEKPYRKELSFFANNKDITPIAEYDTRKAEDAEEDRDYNPLFINETEEMPNFFSNEIISPANPSLGIEDQEVINDVFSISPKFAITKKIEKEYNYKPKNSVEKDIDGYGIVGNENSSDNIKGINFSSVKDIDSSDFFSMILEYLVQKGLKVEYATINDSSDNKFSRYTPKNTKISYLIIAIIHTKEAEFCIFETGVNMSIGIVKNLSNIPIQKKNDMRLTEFIKLLDHEKIKFRWSSVYYNPKVSTKNHPLKKKKFEHIKQNFFLEVIQPVDHRYSLSEKETLEKIGDTIFKKISI